MSSAAPDTHGDANQIGQLQTLIKRHWGFAALRPLQEPAMRAVLQGRDSLLVMPTGGGKSLCYQAPAVFRGDTTVVVSPLISLMKDQVDALRTNGVPAVSLNSSLSTAEQYEAEQAVRAGKVRLLFVSPERLATGGFRRLAQEIGVRSFAIDEAHCISHWGHDFRPEYRQLSRLKDVFPTASIHAFTATATEQVRSDIVEQLKLQQPAVLVGNFDRPNLTYRVIPRHDVLTQVSEVIHRHRDEAGIVYCIRRRDVDDLTAALRASGIDALPYHAGLSPDVRKSTQDAFADERCNLVVATVAFGMGIDRSNIRYVLHTGMPKSIEHYQQETGRAGRDGLEAECVLLYSPGDAVLWRMLVEKSANEAEADVDPDFLTNSFRLIAHMEGYCQSVTCRHGVLSEYFGQEYPKDRCGACDLCLGEVTLLPDGHVVAQKILSCVARVEENFGINHVIDVLRGAKSEAIRKWGHEKLSTYGLLSEHRKADIRNWIRQLIGQEKLEQTAGDRPVLKLNPASWDVMNNRRTGVLLKPRSRPAATSPDTAARPLSAARRKAFTLFADGRSIEDVMAEIDRAYSTTVQYLVEYIERERPATIAPWVPDDVNRRVAEAARRVGSERLKPIFEALDGRVPYDQIRLVRAHLRNDQCAHQRNSRG